MSRKRFTTKQTIHKLREAEVELARGKTIAKVCKQIGITDRTYYRWGKEYGALKMDQARRLKGLERENARLKQVVANRTLDNAILKEVANPNF